MAKYCYEFKLLSIYFFSTTSNIFFLLSSIYYRLYGTSSRTCHTCFLPISLHENLSLRAQSFEIPYLMHPYMFLFLSSQSLFSLDSVLVQSHYRHYD